MSKKTSKSKSSKATPAILHGECMIFASQLPSGAVKEKLKSGPVIIANSEVTGNHHVIDAPAGVDFYKDGERRFVVASKPTQVRCVIADRHSAIDLQPGVWEIGIAQEYDYFAQAKRNVAD
jgi:hypothetical protein